VQEVEIAFQATVDPYFRADVFLTIPNLQGIEVEEAYLTTTSLPGALQLKAGIFRAPFGRQNAQHLHLQDFTRRPEMNVLFLGADGLRSPGAEASWLVPLPFYLLVTAAAFSVGAPDPGEPLASFGGGSSHDFTYLGNLKTFIPINDANSLMLGASFATGKTALANPNNIYPPSQTDPHQSYVWGLDAYFKWKPPNVSQTYMSLAWATELYMRHIPELGTVEGALYTQLVWQALRRWFVGVRGEFDGIPVGPWVPRQYAASGSITWALSEFSRARLYGEARFAPEGGANIGPERWLALPPGWSSAVFLQLEASIGAHGAHPY
jgi:hypothetical protein